MAWRYEKATKTIRSIPENYWIASMDSFDGAVDHEANGTLIAGAPDLLAICQEIASDPRVDLVTSERRIRLYSAIKKSGGDL